MFLNPKKFQFAEDEVDFIGFTIAASGVRPVKEFLKSILKFPTQTSLTDIRSWCSAVDQVSYTFVHCMIMEPLQNMLSSKTAFTWSPSLDAAFKASKVAIPTKCVAGVEAFNPALPIALTKDRCRTSASTESRYNPIIGEAAAAA